MCFSYCVIYLLPFCLLYENMINELCNIYNVTCLIALKFFGNLEKLSNHRHLTKDCVIDVFSVMIRSVLFIVMISSVLFSVMISSVLFSVMISSVVFCVMISSVLLQLCSVV